MTNALALQHNTKYYMYEITGGASAAKEPGHFRDQNILEPGHPDAFFSSKKFI